MRNRIIYGLIIAVLLTVALWSPAVHDFANKPSFAKPILVGLIGTVEAVTADYICDGTDDQAQLQAALNALPASGGELVLLAGTYSVSATVTFPINNITVSGLGDSTYVTFDDATPVFDASGRTGCTFANFRTDGGWVTLGTNTALINMNNDGIRTTTINGVTLTANSTTSSYFQSTVVTGTAPFTVASTTNVTNLNADLLDGLHSSSFTAGTGNVTAQGTVNYITKFSTATNITNSSLLDTGTNITSTADILLASGKNLDIKKVLTSDSSWSGITTIGTAGENLAIGNVVYRETNGKMYKADASNIAKVPVVAISTGTILQDATGTFLIYGFMRYDTWTWTEHGVRLYASSTSTGAMTETAPTGASKQIQEVAIVMDSVIGGGASDIIFFNPSLLTLMDTPANSVLNAAPTSNWAYDHEASTALHGTTVGIAFIIDGGGSVITSGIKGDLEIPFACTITQSIALADTTGNLTVSIWKDTYANYPPVAADNITASAPIATATANKITANITTWTTGITSGDILRFNVDSCSNITRATISLKATRN
jgi:hypothetical protein